MQVRLQFPSYNKEEARGYIMGQFEIYKDRRSEYRFRLRAGNNEPLLASEGYSRKAGCENGIDSVRRNSQDPSRYLKKNSSNGQYYFTLTATNGQVIGTSEMYTTERARDNGIDSVRRNAPSAGVDDQT